MVTSDRPMSNEQSLTVDRLDPSTASEANTLSHDCSQSQTNLPTVPGYQVLRRLGAGGMGEVFEVVNRLGRHFALKIIRPDKTDSGLLVRFRQEAGILQDLDHPQIARIFEYNEVNGFPYFTMRLLPGGTLAEKLGQEQLQIRQVVELLATIAEAVGFLHRRGLLHRDLKPNNILFDDQGQPIVTDFGLVKQLALPADEPTLASSLEETSDQLTGNGQPMGTARYMGPEQIRGELNHIGPPTDVWALGVILYEALTQQRPFEDPHFAGVKALIEKAEPIRPSALRPELDSPLEGIILKCLAHNPVERYGTADDLALALRHWLAQGTTTAAGPPRRGKGRLKVAGVLLGFVVLLGGMLSWFTGKPEPLGILAGKLRRDEPVELLGETGAPPFSEIVVSSPGTINQFFDSDGAFTVSTRDQLVLIELVPPQLCPPRGYRLTGQVRWNDGTSLAGRSGFYVCRTAGQRKGVMNQFFAEFNFVEDAGDSMPGEKVAVGQRIGNYVFGLRRWEDVLGKRKAYPIQHFQGFNQFYTNQRPVLGQAELWRDLELEVRPGGITCKWNGNLVGELSAATITQDKNRMFGVKDPPIVPPLGGIGLQIYEASVSFRSVTITPLLPR